MSTNWSHSNLIRRAHELAEQNGFKLRSDTLYGTARICLQVADDNNEGVWARDTTLEAFVDFEQANAFLSGYEKCQLYWRMGKKEVMPCQADQ